MATFDQFGLKEELVKAVEVLGFTSPSPIQEKAIPLLINNTTDIIALAQTGTGKTAAFGLPLLHNIEAANYEVQGLVLSPTRELCMQIQEEFVKYAKFIKGIHSVAVYGGTPISGQIRELKRGANIVIATPGRLIDLIERGAIVLDEVKTVVLDEADEMLNMGFRDDIDFILKNTVQKQATWLFSATMNSDVRRISKRYMSQPKEVAVSRENVTNENIEHQYFVTNAHHRYEVLKRLLDYAPGIYGIVFTRTKQDAQDVAERLVREGYQVSPLHGDMDQKMRTKVMERFKRKSLQAIVATDVAARGIDVNDITHVINYELPEDTEIYTHRSGRTARAGKSGICMSIVTPREIGKIRQIERIAKSKFSKIDIPEGSEIVRRKLFHYLETIKAAEPQKSFSEVYKSTINEKLEELSKDELIDKLLWLQLKDTLLEYENTSDLNVGMKSAAIDRNSGGERRGRDTRFFINIGTKDGLNEGKLVQFIADATDVEGKLINRVTVRELSSFFNIPSDAADYVSNILSQQRYNGRRVRVEPADKKPVFRDGARSGDYNPKSGGAGYKKSGYAGKKDYGNDAPKFARARKPLNKS